MFKKGFLRKKTKSCRVMTKCQNLTNVLSMIISQFLFKLKYLDLRGTIDNSNQRLDYLNKNVPDLERFPSFNFFPLPLASL